MFSVRKRLVNAILLQQLFVGTALTAWPLSITMSVGHDVNNVHIWERRCGALVLALRVVVNKLSPSQSDLFRLDFLSAHPAKAFGCRIRQRERNQAFLATIRHLSPRGNCSHWDFINDRVVDFARRTPARPGIGGADAAEPYVLANSVFQEDGTARVLKPVRAAKQA